MGAIQAVAFTLSMEKDWSQWKLGWNTRLLIVAYSVCDDELMIIDFVKIIDINFDY